MLERALQGVVWDVTLASPLDETLDVTLASPLDVTLDVTLASTLGVTLGATWDEELVRLCGSCWTACDPLMDCVLPWNPIESRTEDGLGVVLQTEEALLNILLNNR